MLQGVNAPFTNALLSKYAHEVEELLVQNREQGEELKKALWETQLDYALNDEHFWIANNDVKELKEWIDAKTGIDVFYGSQFLQSLKPDEMASHMLSHPLLPYGLVVSRPQWEKINKQVLSGRIYKSPVPIFMREDMAVENQQNAFVMITGTEKELLADKNKFTNWKIQIAKQIEDQKDTLAELEKQKQHCAVL